jgi:hypothetical protein
MATYMPAIIWTISAFVCHYIAKARHVKPNLFWILVVVILGPLAIPLVFLAKPQQKIKAT